MKIVYCMCSVYNPGGMERVLLNKVRWLTEHTDWEVMVVTTDQQGREPFYAFPKEVKMVDLGINYSENNGCSALKKIVGYVGKRRMHKKRLTELLMRERPDITVSLYPSESSFIPDIKDGSRKVLELHFCKFFRLQYGRGGLIGLIDRWRTNQDETIVKKFDKFVVLTNEDRGYWGALPNIEVIPNAALAQNEKHTDCTAHRVIAVGRLDHQKGFDRLLQAWQIVMDNDEAKGWHLNIFGQGEWKEKLETMITNLRLTDSATINAPTKDIASEYARSSMLAMSSNYEGFPMVMIEAMSAGVPVVTFGFKCGPKDIIRQGENGLIVPEGDVAALAEGMLQLISNTEKRQRMGAEARKVTERYSEEAVMAQWMHLFNELTHHKTQA